MTGRRYPFPIRTKCDGVYRSLMRQMSELHSTGCVEHSKIAVVSSGSNLLSVRTEGQREDRTLMIQAQLLVVAQIKNSRGMVITCSGNFISIRTESNSADRVLMNKGADLLTFRYVINSSCVVGTTSSKLLPIGTEGDSYDLALLSPMSQLPAAG